MGKRGFTLIELLIVVAIMAILLTLAISSKSPRPAHTPSSDPINALIDELRARASGMKSVEFVVYGDGCERARLIVDGILQRQLPARQPPKGLEPLAIDPYGNLTPLKLPPLVEANATHPVCFRYAIDRWGFGSFGIYRLDGAYYYLDPFVPRARRFESERQMQEAIFDEGLLPLDGAYYEG